VSLEGLPPLSAGAIPPDVRRAGPDAVAGFRAALGFERTLLTQMLGEALPQPEEGADPREASMPSTFADALISQGGLGMADQLYGSFEQQPR
jgi:hypothetical protein